MGIRDRLRRLKREIERGNTIVVEQQGGIAKRFPTLALEEAFLRNFEFLDACADGDEPQEPTPLQLALMNAAHREPWHGTFIDLIEGPGPVPDLSEPSGPEE